MERGKPILRVAVEEWVPWTKVIEKSEGNLDILGPMANLLHILSDVLDFEYELVRPSDRIWGGPLPNGSWTGLLGLLQRQDVEMAVGPFGVTNSRETVCDFSDPLYSENNAILMARPPMESDMAGFIKPFTWEEATSGLRKAVFDGHSGTFQDCWAARKGISEGDFAAICDRTTMKKAMSWDFSIQSVKESGLLDKWLDSEISNTSQCLRPPSSWGREGSIQLDLEAFVGPFLLLAGGVTSIYRGKMVFPGFVRKLNKTLPALIQVLAVICFIHYVTQGVMTKIQKYNRHYGQLSSSASSPRNVHGARAGGRGALRTPRTTRSTTTTSTTTPPPPPPDRIMQEEQERRLLLLQNACTRWNLGLFSSETANSNITEEERKALSTMPKSPLYQALLVSEKHSLAVCPVARTGLQWLSRRLLQLTGRFDETQLHKLPEPAAVIARHNFPYLSSWEKYPIVLAQSMTILMARHPLDRILASYRHVLENAEKNPNGYLHYGRRIVHAYRKSPVPNKGPTFEEFVRFLLEHDSHHMEDSWQSAIRRCTPCHISYNVILHYETLWNDVQWAWKKAGLGSLNTTDYVYNRLTPEVRRQYFSELTLSQVLGLYKKYRLDFQLLGYTIDEHMVYAKPGEDEVDPVLMAEVSRANPGLQNLLDDERSPEKETSKIEEVKAEENNGSLNGERAPQINNHIEVEDYRQQPREAEE